MKLSEAIYNGLTNFGRSLQQINKDRQDHWLESINLGLVSDDVRLRVLKQELYRNARLGKDTEELRKAIELFLSTENIDSISTAKMNFSIINFWLNTFLLSSLVLLGGLGFTQINTFCSSKQSTFCDQVSQIDTYFNGQTETNLLPDNTDK